MNIKKLNRYGIIGGVVLIFLATDHFLRTYESGEPKWIYLVMSCGMAIILFNTIFRKRTNKKS